MNAILDSAEFHELVHELGNLLAGIRWSADALLAGAAARVDRAQVEQIRQAAERAGELVLRLTAGATPGAAPVPGPASPSAAGSRAGSPTVLLVEDSEMLRPVMRRALEADGYRVLEAAGHAAALELAGRHRGEIHLAIVDLVIPGSRGTRIAREVRDVCPGIGIVLVSGALPGDADAPHPEAIDAFLAKPFTLERLRATARDALARRGI